MLYRIDQIQQFDPMVIEPLCIESRQAGYRFIDRLVNEYNSGSNRFAQPGEALFGAFVGEKLVGVCGINQDPDTQNKNIGRIRHLYILESYRRIGLASSLIVTIIKFARPFYQSLVLYTDNPTAAEFYQSLGFQARNANHISHFLPLKDNSGEVVHLPSI